MAFCGMAMQISIAISTQILLLKDMFMRATKTLILVATARSPLLQRSGGKDVNV